MHTISRSRHTSHSSQTLWEALAAFDRVEDWHPRVERSPGTSRENFGIGASRVCHFIDGTSVNETVTSIEPGRSMHIEITEMSMPLKSLQGRLELIPEQGGARITMTMNFEPKYGPLGSLMATLMMRPMMSKMLDQILEGLDQHLSSNGSVRAA